MTVWTTINLKDHLFYSLTYIKTSSLFLEHKTLEYIIPCTRWIHHLTFRKLVQEIGQYVNNIVQVIVF